MEEDLLGKEEFSQFQHEMDKKISIMKVQLTSQGDMNHQEIEDAEIVISKN